MSMAMTPREAVTVYSCQVRNQVLLTSDIWVIHKSMNRLRADHLSLLGQLAKSTRNQFRGPTVAQLLTHIGANIVVLEPFAMPRVGLPNPGSLMRLRSTIELPDMCPVAPELARDRSLIPIKGSSDLSKRTPLCPQSGERVSLFEETNADMFFVPCT